MSVVGTSGQEPEPLLDVGALSAWYGAARVLFDIGLQVGRGEVVALVGPNGAGKSTTLKAIVGLVQRRGVLRFMGRDISAEETHRIARLGLGFVPEDRRIFGELTVLENLEVGWQPPRRWPDGTPVPSWTPATLFELFPNLGEMPQRRGAQMSGGEQQMLAVARTLMGNPYLILLDEPTEGLAPAIAARMAEMVVRLKQRGVSILLSEQNLAFAEAVADRALEIGQGQVKAAAPGAAPLS